MNTDEMVKVIQTATDTNRDKSRKILDAILATIKTQVQRGQPVHIGDLGAFSTAIQKAYLGRNPSANTPLLIPAKAVVRFTPSQALRDALN